MIKGQWNEVSVECCYYSHSVNTPPPPLPASPQYKLGGLEDVKFGFGEVGRGIFKITRGEPLVKEDENKLRGCM